MLINNNTETLSTHTLSHVPITCPDATKQKGHNSQNERHRFQKVLEIYNSNGKSIIPNIKTTSIQSMFASCLQIDDSIDSYFDMSIKTDTTNNRGVVQ